MSERQKTTSPPCTEIACKTGTRGAAARNKIQISRSFTAVWYNGNDCANPAYHFRGCAREVFSYLELIRSKNNHTGFLFMRVADIIKHTKDWAKGGRPFSERQVKRVLRVFQDLGILGKYETRIIKGRAVSGWQMAQHAHWAEASGGLCDFTYWREYEPNQRTYQDNQRVVIDNGTATVTHNGTDSEDNGTVHGTDASAVMPLKIQILRELQTEKCS